MEASPNGFLLVDMPEFPIPLLGPCPFPVLGSASARKRRARTPRSARASSAASPPTLPCGSATNFMGVPPIRTDKARSGSSVGARTNSFLTANTSRVANSQKALQRQFTARTSSQLQHLIPTGWDVEQCKTRATPRASSTPRSSRSAWQIARMGNAVYRRRERSPPPEQSLPKPPPCPDHPPGVPDGLGGWMRKSGKSLSLELRQKLTTGCVVTLCPHGISPESLWTLSDQPPWIWSPVEEPPGTFPAIVHQKIGENIKVQRLCEDPDEELTWLLDKKQASFVCSAQMVWNVRAGLLELPPSGLLRRWREESGRRHLHTASAPAGKAALTASQTTVA